MRTSRCSKAKCSVPGEQGRHCYKGKAGSHSQRVSRGAVPGQRGERQSSRGAPAWARSRGFCTCLEVRDLPTAPGSERPQAPGGADQVQAQADGVTSSAEEAPRQMEAMAAC